MPLAIVHNEDRSSKKLLMAADISQLKTKASEKFGLPAFMDYKLCLDGEGPEAGLELDEDEAFLELSRQAGLSGQQLALILLPDSTDWTPRSSKPPTTTDSSGEKATESSESAERTVSPVEPSTPQPQRPPPIPIGPICDELDPVLKSVLEVPLPRCTKEVKKRALREVIQYCCKFIEDRVPQYSRPICLAYAKSIFSFDNGKYRPIFRVTVNECIIDDGLEGFTTSLYNALNHRKYTTKRVQGIAPQRKRRRLTVSTETEESVDDVSSTEPLSSKMDDYGCVMYNPPLPSSESTTTQEEKRVLLLTLESDASISDLMKRTYATQRVDVINCRPISKLRDVLVKWPHLKHPKFMFQHASTLLDKDVINVWTTELSNKSSDIFQFLNTLCLSLDRKRSVPSHISDLLATKASCDALDDGETVASAIFPLIMWHLREKASAFLQVIKVGASDEDVLAAAKDANGNPVVVLSGDSIFDPNACVRVVLLKDEIIVADNLLEGILYAFLSFFVFGFCYTPEVRHTLEFIQRSLLLINPGKGTKSSSKTRNAVSPKVSKFLEELRIFSSPWTLHSRQQQG